MIPDCDKLTKYLANQISSQTDIAVVGLSGGADSSLAALLCSIALSKENVFGVSMPYNETDTKTFNAMSEKLAGKLGINHLVRPISGIANAINDQVFSNSKDKLTNVNKGNSRSRARMCVLYGIAHDIASRFPDKKVRVMGTGNLSEDFIGYDTKGGDALADIFPIGELFKSEVYQLLEHFRDKGLLDEENINRTPSAGLVDGQTDEGDLGYTYDEMEQGIRTCLQHYDEMSHIDADDITSYVWKRHVAHKHKHEAPTVIKLRHLCE